MARMVLLVAASLAVSACNDSSQQDEAQAAEQASQAAARERELSTFRERANSLDNPDEVLALLAGTERYSTETSIVNDRLYTLVLSRIEQAKSQQELRELKKYALPGSRLVGPYMRRDIELSED